MIGVRMMTAAAGAASSGASGLLWTPAAIDTALWLDASDESSVTADEYSNVIQWNDKSGNARHATVPSDAGCSPSYTPLPTGSVYFNGHDDALVTPAYLSGIVHTVYIVTIGIVRTGYYFAKGHLTGTDNSFALEATYTGDPDNPVYVAKAVEHHSPGNDCDGVFNRSELDVYYDLDSFVIMYDGGTENYFYENGNQITRQYTVSASGTGSGSSEMCIGCARFDEIYTPMNGEICEIIHVDGFHDEATRQKVEGYLAHKWDAITGASTLRQALPALHPYKTEPPMA